ncbi:MAG: NAD(P)H-quinone oxidoreductase, partial [Rhodospirillaceae bacterium]
SPTLPSTMTVIEITSPGGPEQLRTALRPLPVPGPSEALIAIVAAGVNRPDVIQRQGHYAPPPGASDIPGLEVSGRVVALGADVSSLAVGDKVCALLSGGGYAEYCAVPASMCLPIPVGLTMIEAAALPETFFTVWHNVFERGALKPGESLLVHGGSSGIGTTAIQLGKAFGARVFTTAGSPEKCRVCERLGAERAIDYRNEDFVAVLKELTGKKGVDVILDMVGGDYVARNLLILAADGRHVSIAFPGGSKVTLNLMPVMLKRQTLTGSTLRPRPVAEKSRIARILHEKIWPLLESGAVKVILDRTFPLTEATKAHQLMESSTHIGKIVLEVGS